MPPNDDLPYAWACLVAGGIHCTYLYGSREEIELVAALNQAGTYLFKGACRTADEARAAAHDAAGETRKGKWVAAVSAAPIDGA